jgi:hypothetical protein
VGIGIHTEDKNRLIVYKPLYHPNQVKDHKRDFGTKPIEMFLETYFERNSQIGAYRFRKTTEAEVEKLKTELLITKAKATHIPFLQLIA